MSTDEVIDTSTYLGTLDDDRVGGQVYTPCQCCRGDEHLHVLVGKQILDQRAVDTCHAGVVDGKSVRQQVLELGVLGVLCSGETYPPSVGEQALNAP